MELCNEIIEGMQIVGDNTLIPDSAYQSLLDITYKSIVSEEVNFDIGVKPSVLKQAHNALVTFLLEAAKHNADTTSISPVLEDCKFSQDRIEIFDKMYKKNKAELQILLSSSGFNPAHIVDVDWRLDFTIKNKQLESINEPTYTISLLTEQTGQDETSSLQFNCTQEQLQDLVGKLKDACKSVERSAQM